MYVISRKLANASAHEPTDLTRTTTHSAVDAYLLPCGSVPFGSVGVCVCLHITDARRRISYLDIVMLAPGNAESVSQQHKALIYVCTHDAHTKHAMRIPFVAMRTHHTDTSTYPPTINQPSAGLDEMHEVARRAHCRVYVCVFETSVKAKVSHHRRSDTRRKSSDFKCSLDAADVWQTRTSLFAFGPRQPAHSHERHNNNTNIRRRRMLTEADLSILPQPQQCFPGNTHAHTHTGIKCSSGLNLKLRVVMGVNGVR